MNERITYLGERVTLMDTKKVLDYEISALRQSLRAFLTVTIEHSELDNEGLLNTTLALTQKTKEWKNINKKIQILNNELGE